MWHHLIMTHKIMFCTVRYCPANCNCEWQRAGDCLISRVALYSGRHISVHV